MKIWTFLLILLFPINAFGAFESSSNLPKQLTSTKGKTIYNEVGCIHCHGPEGKGDGVLASALEPKPRNFTSYEEMKRIPDSLIIYSIKNGINGSAMPAHPNLKGEEIKNLVAYVRSLIGDYYHTVNMCITDNHTVNLGKTFDNLKPIDNLQNLKAKFQKDKLVLKAEDPIGLINEMLKDQKRTRRSSLRIVAEDGENKKTIVLSVRIHDCIRGSLG